VNLKINNETTWAKKKGRMQTPWFDMVDEKNIFPEYPRPQKIREHWINLNGLWDYKISSNKIESIEKFDGKILVPFPVEAPLSGVEKPLLPNELLWYRRYFKFPSEWNNKRVLLHFGAVDWKATIIINGKIAGTHKGGYSPFTFDITDMVSTNQENEIIVKVYDPTDKGHQPFGKQTLKPKMVFYTASSGIWQTVWLESVPKTYINDFKLTPNIDRSEIEISAFLLGDDLPNTEISVVANQGGQIIGQAKGHPSENLILKIEKQQLWTPELPHLYDLEILLKLNDEVIDRIQAYFAMRKFSIEIGNKGIPEFHLNNKPYVMIGPLDQGFWPDGLYTAPTDAALLWDIKMTKDYGFNMIRKHIKTEPARWYHYCDKLGIIVLQDMPNGGKMGLIPPGYIRNLRGLPYDDTKKYSKFGMQNPQDRNQFEVELKELVDSMYNVPSIAIWVLFNEAWGQYDAKRLSQWLSDYDNSRLVDHASGWFDQGAGHFISVHNYKDSFIMPNEVDERGVLLSETGGYTMVNPNHVWNPKKKFGYKRVESQDQLHQAYQNLVENVLKPAIQLGLSGIVYTQTSDVEIECNGLVTYDRKIFKFDPRVINNLNQQLLKNN
jgi:beta-galactosidase/beta-glucuronidase